MGKSTIEITEQEYDLFNQAIKDRKRLRFKVECLEKKNEMLEKQYQSINRALIVCIVASLVAFGIQFINWLKFANL